MATGRSTIIIPVPEAEPLIGEYRLRYDPPARRGMPAHITLLYPFLPPSGLDSTIEIRLRSLLCATSAFPFDLTQTAEFPQGVLFLAPEPAEPFIHLTQRLAAAFQILPYAGRIAEPHPHCTIAQEADELMRREIEIKLGPFLPVQSHAREAWLMVRDDETPWQIQARYPLQRL